MAQRHFTLTISRVHDRPLGDDPPCGFALDNHLGRIRIVAVTLIAYAVLQCIVLVRYAADVNWAMPTAWIWIAVLVIMLLMNS